MPTGHKIALFGTGRIGRLIYSGIDALHTAGNIGVNDKTNFLDSLTSVINKQDYNTLVNAYKKVQKRYYPEKDLLVKNKRRNITW